MIATPDLTTTPVELVACLRKRGAAIWIDGNNLRMRAPEKVFTPEMDAAISTHKREIISLLQTEAPIGSGAFCDRCGPTDYRDVPIHGGRSVRRDCLHCGRFIDFPVWYGDRGGDDG